MAVQSRLIFISHSSKDESIVTPFIDKILNIGMGIPRNKIFYTSNEDTGIKSGTEFKKAIRLKLEKATAVIQIITENYKRSEVCLNEMGAAWVLSKKVIPFIMPPISFQSIGFIHSTSQILKLNHDKDLYKFFDDHKDLKPSPNFTISNYHRQVTEFLETIRHGSFGYYNRW
ncbi:MAG: toll/interleukin-1 receptor domain-containing protein [Williamsia sp.]|nr:toll/interleukin-1 receptor domain-containing protein [Williamsia sp.]